MQSSSNGMMVKLNMSKSKKRIIQAKNIQFKPEQAAAQRFKSLSPDIQRIINNTGAIDGKVQANDKSSVFGNENMKGHPEGQIAQPISEECGPHITFSKPLNSQVIEVFQSMKKVQSEETFQQIKTLGSQKPRPLKKYENQKQATQLVSDGLDRMNGVNLLTAQEHSKLSQDATKGQDPMSAYTNIEVNYRSQPAVQSVHEMQEHNMHEQQQKQSVSQLGVAKNKTVLVRNEHTPTTAASSNKRDNLQSADLVDPFSGKPLQLRKKVDGRVDMILESRGSIFTGRDEASVLLQQRQLQQRDLQESLKRQIEDKKKRIQDEKLRESYSAEKELEEMLRNRHMIISQGDIGFSGGYSPISGSQMTLQGLQQPQTSHATAKGVNFSSQLQLQQMSVPQKIIQQQQQSRLKNHHLDVLEEEKSGDTTGIFAKTPQFTNSGIISPNIKVRNDRESPLERIDEITNEVSNPRVKSLPSSKTQLYKKSTSSKNEQLPQDLEILKQSLTKESSKMLPQKLEKASQESQHQIDALSNMVEQLLQEQQNLKDKIFMQEKILETHLTSNKSEDAQSREHGSNRNSTSRDFKIRKSKALKSSSNGSGSRQTSEATREMLIRDQQSNHDDDLHLSKNVMLLNQQIQLKNQKIDLKSLESLDEAGAAQKQQNQQNSRYTNRQSNKLQFIERNEKLKQQNHLIKFGPANVQKQPRVQSLEPRLQDQQPAELAAMTNSQSQFQEIFSQQQQQDKVAVARSIDTLSKNTLQSQRLIQQSINPAKLGQPSQSQDNLKFSNSVKNLQLQGGQDPNSTNRLAQTQNLDTAGQSQLLFFSDSKNAPKNHIYLPEIKKAQPQLSDNLRESLSEVNRHENGKISNHYREPIYSNYYEAQSKLESQGKGKSAKQKREELDMISSILMPDSVVMSSLEQRQIKPAIQNNLINSQKYLSSNEQQQPTGGQISGPIGHIQLQQIDEANMRQSNSSAFKGHQPKKKSSSKLQIVKENFTSGGLKISQSNFYKLSSPSYQQQTQVQNQQQQQQQQQMMDIAARLTFSNFNKDTGSGSGGNNFEAFQIEGPQQQQQHFQVRKQSVSPSQLGFVNMQNRFSPSSQNPQLMVVKKSTNQRLAPITQIQKKITPVKKKFPHDFFGGNQVNPETQPHGNQE